MATKIVTKNSSTASAVPTASDLVQGELAVNVADKRLFTEDNGGSIVELGTNPSTIDINAGSIDGTAIGASSASTGAFTTLTATGLTVDGAYTDVKFKTTQGRLDLWLTDTDTTEGQVRVRGDANNLVFITNTAERMRIDSSGNVGIGTTSPSGLAHIYSSSSGATAGGGGDELILESSATTGLSILSGTSNDGNILFGDSGNSAIGYVQYKHADNALAFGSNASEAMRIDSSGNLLVGKTAADGGVNGGEMRANGETYLTATSAQPLALNRKSTDGALLNFSKDGTSVGSIGSISSDLYISEGNSGLRFDGENNAVYPCSTTASTDGTLTLGASGARFKDLYLSGGAYLGGTGSANKLDDYEEGTWVPTIPSGSGAFTGTPEGVYVKVGNVVHVKAVFSISTNFSNNQIGGLPFTVANDLTSSVFGWNGTVICETTGVTCTATESSTTIVFLNEGDAGSSHDPSTTGSLYRVSVTYKSA